jgi:hypothetical protein
LLPEYPLPDSSTPEITLRARSPGRRNSDSKPVGPAGFKIIEAAELRVNAHNITEGPGMASQPGGIDSRWWGSLHNNNAAVENHSSDIPQLAFVHAKVVA